MPDCGPQLFNLKADPITFITCLFHLHKMDSQQDKIPPKFRRELLHLRRHIRHLDASFIESTCYVAL